jgi:ribosomal protein S17
MTEIHSQVAEKATRYRKAAVQKHNDKTHVLSPNFQVGDYVLVAEHRKSCTSKLQVVCAARDETSVDIICRRFSCIFMRESRI